MKHSLHPQRLILAVLLLAALVSSVCAAEVRIGKDSIYCFSADDFADPARGIYVDARALCVHGDTLLWGSRPVRGRRAARGRAGRDRVPPGLC